MIQPRSFLSESFHIWELYRRIGAKSNSSGHAARAFLPAIEVVQKCQYLLKDPSPDSGLPHQRPPPPCNIVPLHSHRPPDPPAAPQDRIAEPHLDDFRDPPVLPLRDLGQMVIRKNRYSFLNFR